MSTAGALLVALSLAAPAQVTFTKSVDRADAIPGEILTYALEPSWTGTALLGNVSVTDDVPTGTTYVPGSANAGGSEAFGTVSWNLGSNNAGTGWFRIADFSDLDEVLFKRPAGNCQATAIQQPLFQ